MKIGCGKVLYYKIVFSFKNEYVNREKADEDLYWYLAVLYKSG